MIYKTRSITLKDGRSAILRAPRESDAEEMLEYLRTASGETDFLASYPEELKFTAEGERAYLENNLDSPNTMMLVCEVDGKIAGNSQIVFMSSLKTCHRAAVMIGLLREYWGLGIGSALFREMEREAREHGTAQLELEMKRGTTVPSRSTAARASRPWQSTPTLSACATVHHARQCLCARC